MSLVSYLRSLFEPPRSKTSVLIAGRPVLMSKPLDLELVAGVAPWEASFDVPAAELSWWLAQADTGEPVEMVVDTGPDSSPASQRVSMKGLYILRPEPGSSEPFRGFTLVDGRYWWTRPHVLKRYNMRLPTALKRVQQVGGPSFVNLPDESYAPYSLKGDGDGKRPYTGLEIVLDVLTDPEALDIDISDITIDPKVELLKPLNVERFVVDDNGANALARALTKVPGLNLHWDYDGKVRLFSELDIGAEGRTIRAGGHGIYGAGNAPFLSNRWDRAFKVRVLFTRKPEIRLDALPVARPTGSASTTVRSDDPVLVNVVRNPWPNLTIYNPVTKRTQAVTQGAWVPLREYIEALNRLSFDGRGKLLKLSVELIGEALMPAVGFGHLFEMAGLTSLLDPEQRNWMAAIQSIEEHAFRTYKVQRGFLERTLKLEDKLVTGLDPESGSLSPALAFANYMVLWSQKAKVTRALQDGEATLGQNVPGYPSGSNNPLGYPSITSDDQPAPMVFRWEDQQMGVFTLADKPDDKANRAKLLPALGLNLPRLRVKTSFSVFHGGVQEGYESEAPKLDPETAKRAVVMTATPAGPNSKEQLHALDVFPDECKVKLPASMHSSLERDACRGPMIEFRVPANVEVARLKWDDDKADKILALFGANGADAPPQSEIEDLVVNLDPVEPEEGNVPGASIRDIALSIASAYYATVRDRHRGARTTFLAPGKRPNGAVGRVVHSVGTDGSPTTYIDVPASLELLDWRSLLDEGVRATLDKDLEPDR